MTKKLQLCLRCSKTGLFVLVTSVILLFFIISTHSRQAFNLSEKQQTLQMLFQSVTSTTETNREAKPKYAISTTETNTKEDYVTQPPSNPPPNISSMWEVIPGNIVLPVGTEPNPHNYTYILHNSSLCENYDRSRMSILVMITSHADNRKRRVQVRNTWGVRMLQIVLNFRLVFLLGRSQRNDTQELIELEHYIYGDILQEEFPENRTNLGLKSIMGLKWSASHCRHVDYVMKTDDDIFIHVPNLIKLMLLWKDRKLVLVCHSNSRRKIIRRGRKYNVVSEYMPGNVKYFPAYCSGFGYVMSMDTVEQLYAVSLKTPYFFIEDVYITGFCRRRAKIKLIDHSAISISRLFARRISCVFARGRVTSHELFRFRNNGLAMMWELLNTRAFVCPRLKDVFTIKILD